MVSAFGALSGISLRRSRADWPIVASAGLICLLAATLLAAGSIYGSAVAQAGLQRALTDASVEDGGVTVVTRTQPGRSDELDATIASAITEVLGPGAGAVWRFGESETFALPDQPTDAVRDLAVLGSAEALADHATLLGGTWSDTPVGVATPIQVAVTDVVAGELGLSVGDRLDIESRLDPGTVVPIEIGGIFRIDDSTDPYWWGDPQVLDGRVTSQRFDTYGPFFTTDAGLAAAAGGRSVRTTWRAVPDAAAIDAGDVGAIRTGLTELPARLAAATPNAIDVQTGLPSLLTRTERSLLVSRTGVLLLSLQLVVLAAYAVLLSASLLVEHRRIDSATLRSRGAGTTNIAVLAAIEGLMLVVPAVAIAPILAAALLQLFNLIGPLADIGLTLEPAITPDAYVAAAVAGIICLAALLVPAVRGARAAASIHGVFARGETRGIAQRLGLDIALLAVAAIGLWQLRHYGAPLTRSVHGALGIDPLLVAVPALGLLAGAILAIRLVPLLAVVIERASIRRRSLVPSLGARQVARRPLRYSRAALLLMLAMAIGVFAVSYGATWVASQRDQAAFQVGSALRVQPGIASGSIPRWALDRAYAAIPGVVASLPVDRETIPSGGTRQTQRLVALDASTAPSVVELRPDLADASLADLMAPLVAGRPTVEAVRLPGEPRRLRLTIDSDVRALEGPVVDEATRTTEIGPVGLDTIKDSPVIGLAVVVRDARGLLHRFSGGSAPLDGDPHETTVLLGDPVDAGPASFTYPLDLLAIELSVSLPPGYEAPDASIDVGTLTTAGTDGTWTSTSLELPSGWRSTAALNGAPHDPVESGLRGPSLDVTTGGPGLPVLPGATGEGPAVVLTFAPSALDDLRRPGAVTPVVVSDRFLEANGLKEGDRLGLIIAGERYPVVVTAAIRAFPGTEPTEPVVLIDLASLSLLRFERSGIVAPAEEWWLSIGDGSTAAVSEALAAPPIASRSVVSEADLGKALSSDPVALGIIGALAIGFVAAALFALVGFIVSAAVSARERVTEFALLRALGLSSGQLSLWLSLENAVLASASLLAGTALGIAIAWVVLPFITVTQGAATPYPAVEIVVPWNVVAVLLGAGAVGLAVAIAGLAWMLPRIGLGSVMRMSED